ncbi:AAA family ATPase [Clostridium butyricum]|uniref:AAA family ATPase n=1 Tax=Clostridium butyricum TaxID=1492 RepID=UPI0028FD3789|nr:AAA family ATPase [Clostridium butyricum]MDU0324327.1 AAA family ATPase [Clostridium butyricum]
MEIIRENYSTTGDNRLLSLMQNNESSYVFDNLKDDCSIDIDWNGEKDIKDLINFYIEYRKVSIFVDFLELDWGMSTGEFNIFSMFARIYDAIEKIFKKGGSHIMILMDEVDSTFHPNWQQLIIDQLINFLKKVYSKLSFQIILTTHSPVLLSDIPVENVIFLQNIKKQRTHEQTFAANISSLYYDSFFMEKGSIGNLAHKCIVNLIESMNYVINETNDSMSSRKKF